MSLTSQLYDYELSYSIAPIVLVGGVAAGLPGEMVPITSFLDAASYAQGVAGPGGQVAPSGRFVPIPGATVIDNQIGAYPFANQSVAANAIITQPLGVSLLWTCPVNTPGGYQRRAAEFANLQAQLAKHSALGGVFNVATPAYLYTNCILTRLQDVTGGDTYQKQVEWRWDFVQPLLTLEAAQEAANLLMRKIETGVRVEGDPPSGSGALIGVGSPATLQGASAIPAAQPLAGAAGAGLRGLQR